MIAIIATIIPPGYLAYIGSYVALIAAIIAVVTCGWREKPVLLHPTSLAILASIALICGTLPWVYHAPQDLLAPVLILPMLTTIALGLLARPAGRVPRPTTFAFICLAGSFIALVGGAYEHFVLGLYRPGLGNNPIHYSTLAAMSGCLALVGMISSSARWRYVFLCGPVLGLACAIIADSRGPMLGALVMSAFGLVMLTIWLWRETMFRIALLVISAIAAGAVAYLMQSGSDRVASVVQSGLNLFTFTGSPDDIRAAFYASAFEILQTSPLVGLGLGQIMVPFEELFPDFVIALGRFDNLHADWANFAAMAGIVGLIAWVLLLVSPMLLLLDRAARQDRSTVLGTTVLATGQLVMGVSNATFGILPQTMMFAVAAGYFLAWMRPRSAQMHTPLRD
ncbi:hypothetical protein VE26_02230 [Devosia chinhatensis]|uniref:O-antigen ligase-related domain-containing protein n=1 Tax=Devosia chinhatensis TaxID=429727 RepID=A0A0F5FJ09_9HYPH|nr:hypothetical protein VE26_02230 [Devosia chinhatensis]